MTSVFWIMLKKETLNERLQLFVDWDFWEDGQRSAIFEDKEDSLWIGFWVEDEDEYGIITGLHEDGFTKDEIKGII